MVAGRWLVVSPLHFPWTMPLLCRWLSIIKHDLVSLIILIVILDFF